MAISDSNLEITKTSIEGLLIIQPKRFGDARGWFMESFNSRDFSAATGINSPFVQDNHSYSSQFTLRGLHYQFEKPQGKLVRVIAGSVFDVVVDFRKSSPTYGKWEGLELSAQNQRQLWIPPGFAHGFLVLSESAEFLYKTTDFYDLQSEVCLAWNDPVVGIQWPLGADTYPILNAKDAVGLSWEKAPKFE